ncbi:MAG: hypothetical protein ACFCGT_18575 [Sandaracinaceae bacterium]
MRALVRPEPEAVADSRGDSHVPRMEDGARPLEGVVRTRRASAAS